MVLGLFGAADRNNEKRKAEDAQFKTDRQGWKFEEGLRYDNYDYQVREQDTQIANNEANLRFQELGLIQDHLDKVALREYDQGVANRAYDKSVDQSIIQKGFNAIAAEVAGIEQNVKTRDDLLGVMFEEGQTFINYAGNSTGLKVTRHNQLTDAETNYAFTSDDLYFDQQDRLISTGFDYASNKADSANRRQNTLESAQNEAGNALASASFRQGSQLEDADFQYGSNQGRLNLNKSSQTVDADFQYGSGERTAAANRQNELVDASYNLESTGATLDSTKQNALVDADFKYASGELNAESKRRNELVDADFQDASLQSKHLNSIATYQLERRKAQGESQIEAQRAILEGMKAAGKISSSGTAGRSSTKNVLGVMAESGAMRASIAAGLMYAEQGVDLGIAQLKDMLILEQTMVLASRDRANNAYNLEKSLLAQEQMMSTDRANNEYNLKSSLADTQNTIATDRANNTYDLQESILGQGKTISKNKTNNTFNLESSINSSQKNLSQKRANDEFELQSGIINSNLQNTTNQANRQFELDNSKLDLGINISKDRINNKFDLKMGQLDTSTQIAKDKAETEYELGDAQLAATLGLDVEEIAASRMSIGERDAIVRKQIQNSLIQANINADAAILLEPQPLPPLTDPRELYAEYDNPDTDYVEMFLRPQYTELPEFRESPEPIREAYKGARENVGLSNFGDALKIGGMVAGGIGAIGAIGAGASGGGALFGMNENTAGLFTQIGGSLGSLGGVFSR